MPRKRRPILIDTDAGVDDALAIIYAMRSPEINVKAITTVAGNVEVDKCTRNVRHLLEYFTDAEKPGVVQGARKPMKVDLVTAPEVHGADGLGNTQSRQRHGQHSGGNRAAECIRDFCEAYGGQLIVVALGPLTNIARALKKYPKSLSKVKRIVTMGGAFRVPGNTGPVAEFNYFVDPHAAHMVLNSGLPITVVPLDLTQQMVFTRAEAVQATKRSGSRLTAFVLQFTRDYMHYHLKTEGFEGGFLHDPMAVAIAADSSLARVLSAHVDVEQSSRLTRGMSVADFRRKPDVSAPLVEIALAVDKKRFQKQFFQRVFQF
jgi:pyrimidine-specific ribonucleoside hydrolase